MRPPGWSQLAFETGLKEGVHILRALHHEGLLVVIGQDKEALLLYRLQTGRTVSLTGSNIDWWC
jgi:hypothetical protein